MIVGSYMWYHVVYGNGIYVASSHWNAEYISTSADGVTWSEPVQINKSSYYNKLRFLMVNSIWLVLMDMLYHLLTE